MKYAVITYIFGKNKEILRKPLVKDNIEYICVTDQKDLKSNDWKIILDEMPKVKCVRDKMVYVKYNPFKYTDADIICVIDGSIEIIKSIIPLFEQIKENDLLIKLHPERNNLIDELNAWSKIRGLSKESIDKFQLIAQYENVKLSNKFLIESCILVYKRNSKIQTLCENEISYMEFLGNNEKLFLSNQCVLTFLIQKDNIKYGVLNQKNFFKRYNHGTFIIYDR